MNQINLVDLGFEFTHGVLPLIIQNNYSLDKLPKKDYNILFQAGVLGIVNTWYFGLKMWAILASGESEIPDNSRRMMTMATPLITSRDSKGLQAVRIFGAVYDKMGFDDERAQRLNEHPDFAPQLRKLLDELSAPRPATVPGVDEWFELEVDGDVDPMSVVTSAGYNSANWTFLGPTFPGKHMYRVKLVGLGYVSNLEDARQKAAAKGFRLLEGQGREPFKAAFPRHKGRPVVFGGNEWRHPHRDRRVAVLGSLGGGSWDSSFGWSGNDFNGVYLWAVVELVASA